MNEIHGAHEVPLIPFTDRCIAVRSTRLLAWIKVVIRACAGLFYLTILPGLQLAE